MESRGGESSVASQVGLLPGQEISSFWNQGELKGLGIVRIVWETELNSLIG